MIQMHDSGFRSHDIQLASFEGERVVLRLLWAGLVGFARDKVALLGRGLALMPGPQSLS